MPEEMSFGEAIDTVRSERRVGYLRAAEAVRDGHIEAAEGMLSVAEKCLRLDLETTDGALLSPEEPLTVDVTEPADLEDADLLACWSDLLELLERDPVIERGEGDA